MNFISANKCALFGLCSHSLSVKQSIKISAVSSSAAKGFTYVTTLKGVLVKQQNISNTLLSLCDVIKRSRTGL